MGLAVIADHNFAFKVGELLLLANCEQANLFQIKEVYKNWITPQQKFPERYEQTDSQISRLLTQVYFIADTGRTNQAGNPIYALYYRNLNGSAAQQNEWIEGVEDMQIEFGIPSATAIQYYTGDTVPNWQKVMVVRVALLLDSVEAVTESAQSYFFQGKNYNSTDHLLRREWDVVVALRERGSA